MNLFHFKMFMAATKLLRFVFYSELLVSLHQCMEHKNRKCTDASAALLTSATQKHLGCWRKSLQPKCSAVTPLYRPQIKQFLLAFFVERLPGVKAASCQSFISLHSQARLGPKSRFYLQMFFSHPIRGGLTGVYTMCWATVWS